MTTKLYDLTFEIDGDNIELEQDMGCGDVARITLHRIHLRHLAEQADLIPATAHVNPDAVIARLGRQIRTLADRINHLDDCIWEVARAGREDLDHECTYSLATWELATEFVADLDSVTHLHEQRLEHPPETESAAVAGNGQVGGAQSDLLSGKDGKTHGKRLANASAT